ncbi:MAG: ImmA/IrrE family metallo-endopeptidase [Oscillospiraceae bacterium]|nr:ImmA/IrrE family metallo-endopeptidase [Oscillospiraceae bacterium]
MVALDYKLKNNGVPILSNAEIKNHVEEILNNYNSDLLKTPQPIDVEAFTEDYLGLNIHFDNLSHKGIILGRMVFDNRKIPVFNKENRCAEYAPVRANTVLLDNTLLANENVLRSTIMHECGHSIYHAEFYKSSNIGVVECNVFQVTSNKSRFDNDFEFMEHHAKYFSAAILMNRAAMKILCDKDIFQGIAKCFSPKIANDYLAELVAKRFGVSMESARIRLQQLNLNCT